MSFDPHGILKLEQNIYLSCSHYRSSGSELTTMRVGPCFIRWSLKRGEARQRELVGMTAVASGVVDSSSYLSKFSSSESPAAAQDATVEAEE